MTTDDYGFHRLSREEQRIIVLKELASFLQQEVNEQTSKITWLEWQTIHAAHKLIEQETK